MKPRATAWNAEEEEGEEEEKEEKEEEEQEEEEEEEEISTGAGWSGVHLPRVGKMVSLICTSISV